MRNVDQGKDLNLVRSSQLAKNETCYIQTYITHSILGLSVHVLNTFSDPDFDLMFLKVVHQQLEFKYSGHSTRGMGNNNPLYLIPKGTIAQE